jgi:sterol desaturase/sphingolipid hydroxylase (fatty acid hydroxylase superfamily)
MEWIVQLSDWWLGTLKWMGGFAAVFAVLTLLTPCNRGMYWWKDLRGAGADFMYWFLVPLLLRWGRALMLAAGVALVFRGGPGPESLPAASWPLWLQCLAVLLIQDVYFYWSHRLFHGRWAWRFHAIHHSPEVLDWTATARFHFLNSLITFSGADVLVLLLGFPWQAIFVLQPFNVCYSAMVHANLNWTFGPLRHLLASPVFHRWHHTSHAEGGDKNFAATFPILDVIFGTFWMPPGRLPEQFGNGEKDFPDDFWGQFLHPFRRRRRQAPSPPPAPVAASGPLASSTAGEEAA